MSLKNYFFSANANNLWSLKLIHIIYDRKHIEHYPK